MTYHLNIIDNVVELPHLIDIEYNNIDDAYNVLSRFVHSFDGLNDVQGRVVDAGGDDVDYCNSLPKRQLRDVCYGRDDLLAVAEQICEDSGIDAADGEVLCEIFARDAAEYLNWVFEPVKE